MVGREREQQIVEQRDDVQMVFDDIPSSQRILAHLRENFDSCRGGVREEDGGYIMKFV